MKTEATLVNEWRNHTAGGSAHHKTFPNNQQYQLTLTSLLHEVHITLHHTPRPHHNDDLHDEDGVGKLAHPTGIILLEGLPEHKKRKTLGKPGGAYGYTSVRAVHPVPFDGKTRTVRATLKLEKLDVPYIIVPCTQDPGMEAGYSLEVQSNHDFKLELLPADSSPLVASADAADAAEDVFVMDGEEDKKVQAVSTAGGTDGGLGYGYGGSSAVGEREVARALRELSPGSLYVDASTEGLVPSSSGAARVEWLRPRELLDGRMATVDSAKSAVLVEPDAHAVWGGDGDSGDASGRGGWLASALAVLAQSPKLLARCFVPGDHAKRGIVAVRIWCWNEWRTVLTDDRLPLVNGRLLCGGVADEAQLTFALLLKAYAKHHGSYAALRKGRVAEFLTDLTGGVSQKLELGGEESRAWAELSALKAAGALLSCQQAALASRGAAEPSAEGIRPRSTYVILSQVVLSSGERLLCLRNPWASPLWRGKWRGAAPEWSAASSRDEPSPLMQLQASGSPYAAAAVRDDPSGLFWIGLADFVRVFDRVYACRIAPRAAPRAIHFGEWTGDTAGGCLNFACTWRRNPQFRLIVTKQSRVFIALSQPPQLRGANGEPPPHFSIGLCVLRGQRGGRRMLTARRDDLLGASSISDSREVSVTLTLPPSTQEEPHILIPYSFEPGQLGRFKVSAWADEEFQLLPCSSEDEWCFTELSGEWDEKNGGGVPNPGNDRWRHNPQWVVAPPEVPTSLTLILELNPPPHPDVVSQLAIGCLLLRGSNTTTSSRKRSTLSSNDVLAQAGFARAPQVTFRTILEPGESYTLLACTFEQAQRAGFRISMYSDNPLDVSPLSPVDATGESSRRAGEDEPSYSALLVEGSTSQSIRATDVSQDAAIPADEIERTLVETKEEAASLSRRKKSPVCAIQ